MNDFREYVANKYFAHRGKYPDFTHIPVCSRNLKPKPLSTRPSSISRTSSARSCRRWCKRVKIFRQRSLCCLWMQGSRPTATRSTYSHRKRGMSRTTRTLSDCQKPAVIRDIFVFHCYVGCRVGDLYGMTKENIKDGFWSICLKDQVSGKTSQVPCMRRCQVLERWREYRQ